MCLVFLVAAAIVAAIVMKVTGIGGDKVKLPGPDKVRPLATCTSERQCAPLSHEHARKLRAT
jgi:hypothetical protein